MTKNMPVELTAPTVIVGMGPGGLCAAIEAAKKGFSVVLLDKRQFFSRKQDVYLREDQKKYFESITGVDVGYDFIHLNKTQKLLEKELAKFKQIQVRKGCEIKEIDIKNNTLTVETAEDKLEEIQFSHLVAADGTQHVVADLFSANASKTKETESLVINYHDLDKQLQHNAHATISLRVANPTSIVTPKISVSDNIPLEDVSNFQKLGWEKPYPPMAKVIFSETKKNFYIGCQIPYHILDEKNKDKQTEMLSEWGKLIVNSKFKIPPDDLLELDISKKTDDKSQQKNKVKVNAFKIHIKYAENPAVLLPTQRAFVLVGDASMSTNFWSAHGVNHAISDSIKFGECLQKQSFDINSYLSYQQNKVEKTSQDLSYEPDEHKILEQSICRFMMDNKDAIKAYLEELLQEVAKYPTDEILQRAKLLGEKSLKLFEDFEDPRVVGSFLMFQSLHIDASETYSAQIFDTIINLHNIFNSKGLGIPPLVQPIRFYQQIRNQTRVNMVETHGNFAESHRKGLIFSKDETQPQNNLPTREPDLSENQNKPGGKIKNN